MLRCPRTLRPRDFAELETFAAEEDALAEMAEDVAWGEGNTFSWTLFFEALREYRRRY